MFYGRKILKVLSALTVLLILAVTLCSCDTGTSGTAGTEGTSAPDTGDISEATSEAEAPPSETVPDYDSLKGDWFMSDMDVSHLEGKKLAAITVDDGPTDSLEEILDVLEELDARATFFLVGMKINDDNAPLIRRIVELGSELGNQSYTHPKSPNLMEMAEEPDGEQKVREEFEKTHNALYAITGIKNFLIRPAFGAVSERSISYCNAPTIGFCVDAADWDGATVEEAYENVINNVTDGAIILTHENPTTVESLKLIIPKLREMGYEVVTVSELAAARGVVMNSNGCYVKFPPDVAMNPDGCYVEFPSKEEK